MVVLGQIELDNHKQIKSLEKLFVGLESMRPKIVVITGRLFSDKVNETE